MEDICRQLTIQLDRLKQGHDDLVIVGAFGASVPKGDFSHDDAGS